MRGAIPWHTARVSFVDDAHALNAEEVAARVAAGQSNDLPDRSGRTVGDIVRTNVFTRINAILAVLFAIVLSTGSWINGAFGLLIIVNSAIGIIQELRAKRTLDNLAVIGEAHPIVRRVEGTGPLPADEVVLDDIIECGPGDQIVVDGTVIEASYLELDESLLTGESDPEPKEINDMVLSGSFVVSGTGAYRATRVGQHSYAAQLTSEASRFSLVHSELQQGINKILRLITWLLIPVGIASVIVQLSQVDTPWRQAVLRAAGAIVPMVPEGLVLLTSMAFALGVIRLGKRQCLVQEMPAIEGLARVDVVCVDKTGTLTETGMRLAEIIPLGEWTDVDAAEAFARVCGADERPNASVQAIIEGLHKPAAPTFSEPREATTVVALAPFSSAKKWSGVSFADDTHWVLGAPEVLASDAIAAEAEQISSTGLRVLLLGQASTVVDSPEALGTIDPVGFAVLEQRIRSDVQATLDYLAEQDVEVKVISGDNAASVGAVARELGIEDEAPVDARTLLTDDDVAQAVAQHRVFGRVTPHQKRAMVAALQEQQHTVAMTGDGVNDVLALKDADLGIAMGSGSAASRAVAKIVLLDDKFATLPHVVAEGRRVLGNIERVANLFLTKTIYSAFLAFLVVLWRIPFPFMPIHVTITGWFTIGIPAFLMSLAPNNDRARPGFVARVLRLGLPAGVITAAATFTTYIVVRPTDPASSVTTTQASTATLAALIISATWVLSVVARPYEWWRILLVVASVSAYLVIFTWPVTQQLFFLDTSNTAVMVVGLVAGSIGAGLIELTWWVRGLVFGEKQQFWKTRRQPIRH